MGRAGQHSETPATQWLRRRQVAFGEHGYDYVEHGGARQAARQLGVDPHQVAKTLIMEDEGARPLIVLMHGDCQVSSKNLARQTGAKRIQACTPATAQRHSGYQVGGTSPFATRKQMPIWVEQTLLQLPLVFVNGGRRGLLISLAPGVFTDLLGARPVSVALAIDPP